MASSLPPLPILPPSPSSGSGRPIATMAELKELREVGEVGEYRILYQAGISFKGHEKIGLYIAQALDRIISKDIVTEASEEVWNDIWMRYENVDDWYMELATNVTNSFTGAVLMHSAVAHVNVGDRLQTPTEV